MATEFKFPDEKEDETLDDEIIVEVEDTTPPEDRNKPPLPEKVREELYNDELEDYSTKVKKKLLQMKKLAHDERREKDAALREQTETIEDVYEPFLIQQGLIARTPRGRVAMPSAWTHLGLVAPVQDPHLFS